MLAKILVCCLHVLLGIDAKLRVMLLHLDGHRPLVILGLKVLHLEEHLLLLLIQLLGHVFTYRLGLRRKAILVDDRHLRLHSLRRLGLGDLMWTVYFWVH